MVAEKESTGRHVLLRVSSDQKSALLLVYVEVSRTIVGTMSSLQTSSLLRLSSVSHQRNTSVPPRDSSLNIVSCANSFAHRTCRGAMSRLLDIGGQPAGLGPSRREREKRQGHYRGRAPPAPPPRSLLSSINRSLLSSISARSQESRVKTLAAPP